MKSKIMKIAGVVIACIPGVVVSIIGTIGDINNEKRMEDHESRLAALENQKES